MANTSATGGALVPNVNTVPTEDDAFLDFIHDWIVGLTGLDNKFVRPRWQPEQVNIPHESVNWLAFGISSRESDTFAAVEHIGIGDGKDRLLRHERLELAVSCYGPNANTVLQNLKDGMQIGQNREALTLAKMNVLWCGDTIAAPELIKEKWLYRVDMNFCIVRQIIKDYPVFNLLSATGVIHNEHSDVSFNA